MADKQPDETLCRTCGKPPGFACREHFVRTINELNQKLDLSQPLPWDEDTYTEEHLKDPLNRFRHALLHATKALGKIAGAIEPVDHKDEVELDVNDVAKYLADLVICASRMSQTLPGHKLNLEQRVLARLERNKNKGHLD